MSTQSSHRGAGPPVRVSPLRLRSAGDELDRVGHDLARRAREAVPVTAAAAAGCPDWTAGGAAAQAAHNWHEFLTDLAGQVDELSQALRAAADAYQACDERAAAHATSAVAW